MRVNGVGGHLGSRRALVVLVALLQHALRRLGWHHEWWSCSESVPNERDAAPPMALAGLEEVHDESALDGRDEG